MAAQGNRCATVVGVLVLLEVARDDAQASVREGSGRERQREGRMPARVAPRNPLPLEPARGDAARRGAGVEAEQR